MEHNLLALEGAVMRYFADRENIDRRPLRSAINESYQEIWERARDAEAPGIEAIATVDLVADQNIYPFPSTMATLKGVERLDFNSKVTPLTEVPHTQRYRAERTGVRGYCVLPGDREILLLQNPVVDLEDGMRLIHLPRTVALVADLDIPLLPSEIHETLVLHAAARVRAWATPKSPKELDALIGGVEGRLIRFMHPSGRASVRSLVPSHVLHFPRTRRP